MAKEEAIASREEQEPQYQFQHPCQSQSQSQNQRRSHIPDKFLAPSLAKTKPKARTKPSPKTIVKSCNKSRSRITEIANADASSEDSEPATVPTSSFESENDEGADSSEAEDCGVEQRSLSEEEEEEDEEEDEEEEEKMPKSDNKKSQKGDAKSKGKKRSRKGEAKEKSENALYTFPMNRISRIVKSEDLDVRIMQEAVFVINKASEKFLQLFCKEAYAHAFLNKKKQIAYDHLSSVVSKRKRFQFLSDIVPEKVKAEDALK